MPRSRIQKLIAVFMMLMITLTSFAQRYHFVYIQADNQQPFYVKYGNKNYSSSSIGYLILPKLSDGDLSIQIGFPKNLYPEQTFNLSVAGKDYGFALKNFDAKGWGLFNFQTTDIVMNAGAATADNTIAKQTTTTTNNSNPFGNMLADAINDSTLNQQHTAQADAATKSAVPPTASISKSTPPVMSGDTANSRISDNIQTSSQPNNPTAATTVDNTIKNYINEDNTSKNKTTVDSARKIVKSSEQTTSNGTDLIFLDNAGKDTIHAFIPSADTASVEKKAAMADTAKSKIDNPFFSNGNATTSVATQPAITDSSDAVKNNRISNTNCQKIFSSYDADKLKKKIASLDNQDAVLAAVKKSLRDKCITTEQIQDLGNLFLSDENRFGFYEAVYPSVSDYFNYSKLENTLIDTNYKNRFKALLRQ